MNTTTTTTTATTATTRPQAFPANLMTFSAQFNIDFAGAVVSAGVMSFRIDDFDDLVESGASLFSDAVDTLLRVESTTNGRTHLIYVPAGRPSQAYSAETGARVDTQFVVDELGLGADTSGWRANNALAHLLHTIGIVLDVTETAAMCRCRPA